MIIHNDFSAFFYEPFDRMSAKKETVRTPEDPDHSLGFATVKLGPRAFSGFNEVDRRSSPLPDRIFLTTSTCDCNFRWNV